MVRSLSAAAALALSGPAWACGGFFCNNDSPVEQAGEDIFFYVDGAAGTVTMHVQVEYEGPAEDFAWIVPVPVAPDLEVSTETLFTLLSQTMSPSFRLDEKVEGECKSDKANLESNYYDLDASAGGSNSPPRSQTGVNVIETGEVGPYETAILTADSSSALLTWLQGNGYDLPGSLEPVLAPYVAGGQAFVALKLQKDKDTGDLTPLALTYPGDTPAIPIQLTSVAATPDMRLRVTIAGPSRAVPESYLHLEANPYAIDWWTGGSNWDDVITDAASQAGGHGFATDSSGKVRVDGLHSDAWDTAELALASSSVEFILALMADAYPADQTLMDILDAHVQVPASLENERVSVYNCPECYYDELVGLPFDAAAAAADVEELIVAPRKLLSEMLDGTHHVTRLSSSLSPVDMTVDPLFGFNPDLPEVKRERAATLTWECKKSRFIDEVPRRLSIGRFPDLLLPSQQWLADAGMTEHEYIVSLHEPKNERIEATARVGDPEVVQDNWQIIADKIDAFNEEHRADRKAGCGCATPGPGGLAWTALPLLAVALRRRR